MSGSKRKSQYRKSVTTNYLHTNITLEEGDYIAKIICSRGANLFEIEVSENEKNGLGLLPNKFRNLIWIKRNDFVIVTTTTSDVESVEVIPDPSAKFVGSDQQSSLKRFEIKEILNAEHIKHLRSSNQWPMKFKDLNSGTGVKVAELVTYPDDNMDDEESEEEEEAEETDRFGNTIVKNSESNVPIKKVEDDKVAVEPQIELIKVVDAMKISHILNTERSQDDIDSTPITINNNNSNNSNSSRNDDNDNNDNEYDEYEEESEDERHVEYTDDSTPLDACCMNNRPNELDVTCSLCTVKTVV
jgi:probable RNA-binding protein EIF1AD